MRWKIILPNLLVVLAVGLVSWLYLRSYYTGYLDDRARDALERDRGLFEAANQLRAVKFLRTVVARSRYAEVQDVFAPVSPQDIAELRRDYGGQSDLAAPATEEEVWNVLRVRAHTESQSFRTYLSQEAGGGRPPELVAFTDRNGRVISRDVDPNAAPVGQNLAQAYPSVRQALEGNAVRDIWYYNNQFLLDVAVAPVTYGETVAGTLLVGYDISNGVASSDRDMFGLHVAYIFKQDNQWRVHSSSLETSKRPSLLQRVQQEQQVLNQSMADRNRPHFIELDVAGEDHIALAGALSGENSSVPAGYIMAMSVEDVRQPANRTITALFAALGGAIVVLIVGFLLGSYFLKPVEEIEEGVLRIINGDHEHRFEVKSAEFGGLAYRVNQLVGALTGEEEESGEQQGGAPTPPFEP